LRWIYEHGDVSAPHRKNTDATVDMTSGDWKGRVPESQIDPDTGPPARPGFVFGGVEISSELFQYLYAAGTQHSPVMSTAMEANIVS